MLSANLNLTNEPRLKTRILPFTLLNISGQSVGVIGYMSPYLKTEGSPGNTVDVSDPVAAVRGTVEELQTTFGVSMIICLSSNDEFSDDVKLAQQVSGIDVIVGAYGDSLLINNNTGNYPSIGAYPFVAQSPSGRPVLITSLSRLGKHIGHLNVTFDSRGFVSLFDPLLVSRDSWLTCRFQSSDRLGRRRDFTEQRDYSGP